MTWKVITGDCREVMAQLDESSVDSVVTDGPYGLEFMGKKWDRFGTPQAFQRWCEEWARQAMRVLKPGGHLLSFGGTRTYHRMASGVEDAGFEVRDMMSWLYGSGFPKSLDVSKAIDAAAGAAREVVGENPNHRPVAGVEYAGVYAGGNTGAATITAPATDAARAWNGWGTALKPACEPIVLARKPLIGTVAANVQAHGTGALNIDACRIEGPASVGGSKASNDPLGIVNDDGWSGHSRTIDRELRSGRWPANVLLDEEAATLLDEQSGDRTGSNGRSGKAYSEQGARVYDGAPLRNRVCEIEVSKGGASRFFYVAKASASERDTNGAVDNDHPTVKPVALMRWLCWLVTPPDGLVLDPFCGSGTTGIAALQEGFRFVGAELDPASAELARRRIEGDSPLFNRSTAKREI